MILTLNFYLSDDTNRHHLGSILPSSSFTTRDHTRTYRRMEIPTSPSLRHPWEPFYLQYPRKPHPWALSSRKSTTSTTLGKHPRSLALWFWFPHGMVITIPDSWCSYRILTTLDAIRFCSPLSDQRGVKDMSLPSHPLPLNRTCQGATLDVA